MGIRAPTRLLLCFSNQRRRKQRMVIKQHQPFHWSKYKFHWDAKQMLRFSYLCTSLSPLLFVICHVKARLGSKPGWEISSPCFFTSLMYLEKQDRLIRTSNKPIHNKMNLCKCLLFSIKMFDPEVLIPNKYILIWCNNIWMQKPLGIPPSRKSSWSSDISLV